MYKSPSGMTYYVIVLSHSVSSVKCVCVLGAIFFALSLCWIFISFCLCDILSFSHSPTVYRSLSNLPLFRIEIALYSCLPLFPFKINCFKTTFFLFFDSSFLFVLCAIEKIKWRSHFLHRFYVLIHYSLFGWANSVVFTTQFILCDFLFLPDHYYQFRMFLNAFRCTHTHTTVRYSEKFELFFPEETPYLETRWEKENDWLRFWIEIVFAMVVVYLNLSLLDKVCGWRSAKRCDEFVCKLNASTQNYTKLCVCVFLYQVLSQIRYIYEANKRIEWAKERFAKTYIEYRDCICQCTLPFILFVCLHKIQSIRRVRNAKKM